MEAQALSPASAPAYVAIRKDFAFDHRCPACNQHLTTNTGYLLRDMSGGEAVYGPTCAKKLTGTDLRGIPDLTKAIASTRAPGATAARKPGTATAARSARGARDDLERAARYVLLRQRHLAHIPTLSFYPLQKFADRLADHGTLKDKDVRAVLEIEHGNDANRPELSLRNLQTVYAYDVAIVRALVDVPTEKQGFLISVQTFLRRHLFLTAAQIEGVEKWFAKIPRFQPLDSAGFYK